MPLGLETCVTAGKALGALFAFASNLDEKRRKNVAEYLEAIADALDGIASAAEEGKAFGRQCASLKVYSAKLSEVCSGVAEVEVVQSLAEQLSRAATSPGRLSQQQQLAAATGQARIHRSYP